jgi:hypothetical protein
LASPIGILDLFQLYLEISLAGEDRPYWPPLLPPTKREQYEAKVVEQRKQKAVPLKGMLSAVLNGAWIWCRILRLRHRESSNFASPKPKTLRGFKGPGTKLSMILHQTPNRAATIAAVQVNEGFEGYYLLNLFPGGGGYPEAKGTTLPHAVRRWLHSQANA